MKITLYTVTDCQFSKQELEYLKSHNLQFEEKNLEMNKDFLTEMLAVGDNFAGTPLTRVEKDDGQITVLKGFTKEEFDIAFGFKKPEEVAKPPAQQEEIVQTSTPVTVQPASDVTQPATPASTPTPPQPTTTPEPPPIASVIEPPSDLPATPAPEPPQPAPTSETPPIPPPQETPKPPQDEKLTSVLNNLQSMSNQPTPAPATTDTPKPASSDIPTIPDPKFG